MYCCCIKSFPPLPSFYGPSITSARYLFLPLLIQPISSPSKAPSVRTHATCCHEGQCCSCREWPKQIETASWYTFERARAAAPRRTVSWRCRATCMCRRPAYERYVTLTQGNSLETLTDHQTHVNHSYRTSLQNVPALMFRRRRDFLKADVCVARRPSSPRRRRCVAAVSCQSSL